MPSFVISPFSLFFVRISASKTVKAHMRYKDIFVLCLWWKNLLILKTSWCHKRAFISKTYVYLNSSCTVGSVITALAPHYCRLDSITGEKFWVKRSGLNLKLLNLKLHISSYLLKKKLSFIFICSYTSFALSPKLMLRFA